MKKEIIFLRTFAACTSFGFMAVLFSAFGPSQNQHFETIDVERINIVERDGTVKMVITNVAHFPDSQDTINNRAFHDRKKRAGMLFFNEDGMECGGFIYDGAKTENGHSAGLSLTFDQYDGDQVMQLLTTDEKVGGKRFKKGGIIFNDRPDNESQQTMVAITAELEAISDLQEKRKKFKQYQEEGLIGGAPRVYLGKTGSENNGLFLFDNEGRPRAMFYVDKDNQAKLELLDEAGNVTSSLPNNPE